MIKIKPLKLNLLLIATLFQSTAFSQLSDPNRSMGPYSVGPDISIHKIECVKTRNAFTFAPSVDFPEGYKNTLIFENNEAASNINNITLIYININQYVLTNFEGNYMLQGLNSGESIKQTQCSVEIEVKTPSNQSINLSKLSIDAYISNDYVIKTTMQTELRNMTTGIVSQFDKISMTGDHEENFQAKLNSQSANWTQCGQGTHRFVMNVTLDVAYEENISPCFNRTGGGESGTYCQLRAPRYSAPYFFHEVTGDNGPSYYTTFGEGLFHLKSFNLMSSAVHNCN